MIYYSATGDVARMWQVFHMVILYKTTKFKFTNSSTFEGLIKDPASIIIIVTLFHARFQKHFDLSKSAWEGDSTWEWV